MFNPSEKEETAIDEKKLVSEIRAAGYKIDSVWDLVNNRPHPFLPIKFTSEYKKAYPILVKHLKIKHHKKVTEGIIRALMEKDAKDIAGETILKRFFEEKDKHLKWVLAACLRTLYSWRERQKYPEIKVAFESYTKK